MIDARMVGFRVTAQRITGWRFIAAFLLSADLADVDHALDAFRKLYESTELGHAGYRPFNHRAYSKPLRHLGPWIAQSLLQAQSDAALAQVYGQSHRFYDLARLHHVAGHPYFLGPR